MSRWWRILRIHPTQLRPAGAFFGARDSAVAIIMAVMLLPLIVAAGGALDLARLYIAKSRLIYALDSAAIAVGVDGACGNATTVFNAYFDANYPTSKFGTVTPDTIVPTDVNNVISANATVTVNTFFLRLIGINTLSASHATQVVRDETAIELALVLDNTDSMVLNGLMAPLKTAAGQLLDVIFRCQATPPTTRVAIVPYAGTVNIGAGNAAYAPDPGHEYPTNVDTAWKGCVEARGGGYDVTDDPVAVGGTWAPFFWEAEHYYYDGSTEGSALFQCPTAGGVRS